MALALQTDSPISTPLQWPDLDGSVDVEDEWAGMGDAKERRKRQNRLNQRAFRQRRRAQQKKAAIQEQIEEMIAQGDVTLLPQQSSSTETSPTVTSASNHLVTRWERKACFLGNEIDKLLERFSHEAVESYVLGSPSADHLLTLCKVNVFRAFIGNMIALGMSPGSEWMDEEALSPFSTLLPGYVEDDQLPVSLRPTVLQRTTLHHPWLDFFPFARIRDNLISAGDFDDHPLCEDIMGFWDSAQETCGLVVWGDPTDPHNWEVSEHFLRKWPWVVAGCPELLESTNRWRSQRGEKMIFRYL
ncbi:hypothetical protein BDW59DRAFT_58626 [Aspergillus cavernicola]|uniref:BZIP domain-containing protein n=1 Tax=Aspergillus cavernicola TaxID=176166 RepID=A0ABR4IHG5_9EURO